MLLLAHVVPGILLGMWFGLSRQLGGLAAVTLGFGFGPALAGELGVRLQVDGPLGRFALFALAYAAIALGCLLTGRGLRRLFVAARLGGYDRHLGAFLGGAFGLALCAITTVILLNLYEQGRHEIRERPSGRLIARAIESLHEAMPPHVGASLAPYLPRPDPNPD